MIELIFEQCVVTGLIVGTGNIIIPTITNKLREFQYGGFDLRKYLIVRSEALTLGMWLLAAAISPIPIIIISGIAATALISAPIIINIMMHLTELNPQPSKQLFNLLLMAVSRISLTSVQYCRPRHPKQSNRNV